MIAKKPAELRKLTMGVRCKANLGNFESLDFEIEVEGRVGEEPGLVAYLKRELRNLGAAFVDPLTLEEMGPKAAGQVARTFKDKES